MSMVRWSEASGSNAIAIAALCVPTLGFLAVRALVPGAGPQSAAGAAPTVTVVAPTGEPAPAVADADVELLAVFAREESAAAPRLSMGIYRAPPPPPPAPVVVEVAKPPVVRVPPELPGALGVTSVMRTGGTLLATVQGRLCRVGDKVATDWTIVAIDDHAGSVTLRHAEGDERTLTLRERR